MLKVLLNSNWVLLLVRLIDFCTDLLLQYFKWNFTIILLTIYFNHIDILLYNSIYNFPLAFALNDQKWFCLYFPYFIHGGSLSFKRSQVDWTISISHWFLKNGSMTMSGNLQMVTSHDTLKFNSLRTTYGSMASIPDRC